ncbi:MAG: hypothetical protein K2I89_07460 [Muribaculaceae bacterium]|nr:hypothetical protein [Muribaculaceae bacterium]
MKKILLIGLICLQCICSFSVQAQSKDEKKAIKKELKALEKDGWKSSKSGGLALAMSKHSQRLNSDPNLEELSGMAFDVSTPKIGESKAREDAISQFVDYCGSMVRGRITSDTRDVNGVEADNIVAGYERILSQAFQKELIPSYYRYREVNGKYQVVGYFLFNLKSVQKSSDDALKEAMEEAGKAFDYGNSISDFIKEGMQQ